MFRFLNKNENSDATIMSPVDGRCIDLSDVNDPVFSEKMMGDGVAFVYEDEVICAPCSGIIAMIANTNHAIAIKGKDDIEILIHVGLNTVELNGQGLKALVKVDQKVKLGTPLIRIDREFMKEKLIDLTTPMIIINSNNYNLDIKNISKDVKKCETEIIKYIKVKGDQ